MATLRDFWNDGLAKTDIPFEGSEAEGATLDLRKALKNGLRGQISYVARLQGALVDRASADDFLVLNFDAGNAGYAGFCLQTLPELIGAFQPYRGVVESDADVAMEDWEIVRKERRDTGKNINGRDSVFRIWPVNYFDDLLCARSFGMSAAQVVERVSTACERAEIVAGGAFVVVTTALVTGDALNQMNSHIASLLSRKEGTR